MSDLRNPGASDAPIPRTLPDLTSEESRYLDGALPPEAAARMDARIASDPALRARLEAWRAATRLWTDDARRGARAIDPDRIADRALAVAGATRLDEVATRRVARRYVRAAAALLALGAGGTAWLSAAEPSVPVARTPGVDAIEHQRLELQAALELLALPVAGPSARGG